MKNSYFKNKNNIDIFKDKNQEIILVEDDLKNSSIIIKN